MKNKLASLGCALLLSAGMVGCAGAGGTNFAADLAREDGVCFGRVIDRSTRAGISGATVEIFAGDIPTKKDNTSAKSTERNFVETTTTASDDADTTLFDEAGMFRFSNLPTGGDYRLRVGATNYATVETVCGITMNSEDNTPRALDMGDLSMTKAVSLTVKLTSMGAAVASCPVFASPGVSADPAGSLGGFGSIGGIEVSTTTDATGSATLAGLNPLLAYTIVAPACDNNSDGIYDFQTKVFALDSAIDSDKTIAMEAIPVGRDDVIALVDTTAKLVADTLGTFFPMNPLLGIGGATTVGGIDDLLAIGKSDSIILVFNYPVSISSAPGIELIFSNNLISSIGVAGFPVTQTVATDCSLSGGDTVLTCTPTGALVVNEMYMLSGTVAANINSRTNAGTANQTLNLGDLDQDATADTWYVYDASATGLSSTSTITADNYNGTVSGAGGVDLVYLEFPELVYGTWNATATTDGATVTVVPGCFGDLTASAGILFEGNDPDTAGAVTGTAADGTLSPTGTAEAAGCTGTTCPGTKVVYRVPLTAAGCGGDVSLNDSITGTTRAVTVSVDATDVEGNRLQESVTLNVE